MLHNYNYHIKLYFCSVVQFSTKPTAMENVKKFLESSTIHGVAYIPSARKYVVKVFWTWVVITAFIGATIVIRQSLEDWSDNPISTTIEANTRDYFSESYSLPA